MSAAPLFLKAVGEDYIALAAIVTLSQRQDDNPAKYWTARLANGEEYLIANDVINGLEIL